MLPFWLPAVLAPLMMTLEVSMDLLQPRFMQALVDKGVQARDLPFVLHTGLLMIGVALVGVVGGVGCTIFSTIAGLHFGTAIRGALFTQIQRLSYGNLDRLQTGGLVTRLTNDVDQVQEAALMFLRILVRAPLLTVGSLVMAALTAPRLVPLLLIIGPLVVLLLAMINAWAHPLYTAMQDALDRVNTLVQENLAGVRVVKAFVRGAYEADRFDGANTALRDATVDAGIVTAAVLPGMVLLLNAGIVCALWFGGRAVTLGGLQVGQLLAFINYLLQMLFSLMMVGMMIMRVTRAEASAERILEVLHDTPEVQDPEPAGRTREPATAPASLAFDGVSFSYGGSEEEPVLQEISFEAPAGATVVILGATGAGKSTLVHLIPRLYDVTAGRITLDRVDVRDVAQEALRREIAIVLQETILFSGTIRDNLRYGRADATDAEIEEAARLAQAHDFVCGFPDGYDTVLGQRGVNLSGGQKQRLAIARALVARPRLLILDDCTSAVDMVTEAAILEALRTWEHRCTRVMVAQRIGAALDADLVLVLEGGRLVAAGTHEELWRSSAVYQEIVRSQRDGQEVRHG
jgi:ATP-binding cassette subfamily B protein